MKWVKIITDARKMREPKKYKKVLVAKNAGKHGEAPSAIVGYRNSHGDFITPGANDGWGELGYYCDCLPDNFSMPYWEGVE